MAMAILKLSYNNIGETSVIGGICGTAFFINENTALTAHHGFGRNEFKPNPGYRFCQYWLVSRNGNIIPIKREFLRDYPDIDITMIDFPDPQHNIKTYNLSHIPPVAGENIHSIGYIGNRMPNNINVYWREKQLAIKSCNLEDVISDCEGVVKKILTFHIRAKDVNLKGVKGFETSFKGVVGMSGSPVIRESTGEVIGILSIGLPPDVPAKKSIFAVSAEEILKKI